MQRPHRPPLLLRHPTMPTMPTATIINMVETANCSTTATMGTTSTTITGTTVMHTVRSLLLRAALHFHGTLVPMERASTGLGLHGLQYSGRL